MKKTTFAVLFAVVWGAGFVAGLPAVRWSAFGAAALAWAAAVTLAENLNH